MPALYPENTQYTPTPPAYNPKAGPIKKAPVPQKTVSPGAAVSATLSSRPSVPQATQASPAVGMSATDLSSLISTLQQTLANKLAGAANPQQTSAPLGFLSKSTGPSPDEIAKMSASFPMEAPIAQAHDKYAPLPAGYDTWKTDENGRWVSPSDKAQIVTMPESLGGGQYVNDPSQPGALIRSNRGYDQQADNIMRTGLYSKDVQIDHIIPLWAGGADTVENRQLLRTDEHAKKTKIQAVPLTLLSAGLINKNEALIMAQNWKDIENNYDIGKIPTPFAKTDPATGEAVGMLDLNTAKKLADEWSKPAPVTFKKVLKAVPEAFKTVGKGMEDVGSQVLPAPLWGALKGFMHEATLGIVPNPESTYEVGKAGFLGKKTSSVEEQQARQIGEDIGNKIGSIAGFIWGFIETGGMVGGAKAAAKEVGAKMGIKGLAEAAASPIVRSGIGATEAASKLSIPSLMKTLVPGAGIAEELAPGIVKGGQELVRDIQKAKTLISGGKIPVEAAEAAAKAVPGAKPLVAELPWAQGGKIPVKAIGTPTKEVFARLAKSAAGQAAYGQLRTTVPVLIGAEKEPGVEERMKQLFFDAAYGGLLGNTAQNFKGYAKLGSTVLGLSLMEGQDPASALTNAVSMMALHGVSSFSGGKDAAKKSYNDLLSAADEQASKTATKLRSYWLPETYEQYAKDNKALPRELAVPEKINAENNLIYQKMDRLVAEGKWSPEQRKEAEVMINTSGEQLKSGGYAEIVQNAKAVKNIQSVAEYLKNRENGSSYMAPNELMKIDKSIPEDRLFSAEPNPQIDPTSKMPNMKMQVTGVASNIDPVTNENQLRFKQAMDEGRASNKVFLVRRDSLEPLIRSVNDSYSPKEISNLEHKPSSNPWNNVEVWGVMKDPSGRREYVSLGWLPRKFRIDEGKFSINNRIDEINKQYGANFPKYDSVHNKDLAANTMRGMDADISTAYVTKAGVGKESGQPFMEVVINDNNWRDAQDFKQYYKEPRYESPIQSAISKAENNPQDVAAASSVIDSMAERAPVTPESVLNISSIPNGPGKEAVKTTTDFFAKALKNDSADQFMADVNKKFGNILSPEEASLIVDNKKNITVKDVGDILYKGIKEGNATPETEIFYKEFFVPFFKDTQYQVDNISSFFTSVPILGKTPADRAFELQSSGKMPIAMEVPKEGTPEATIRNKDRNIAVFESKFTPENRIKSIDNPEVRAVMDRLDKLKDKKLKSDVINLAWKDELSGLLNADYYHQSKMAEKPQVFLDLDKFHDINNTYGYGGGDAVIRSLAEKMNKYFPNRGIRRGGEEFILDVEGLPYDETVSRIKKIDDELRKEKFKAGKDAKGAKPGSDFGDITFTASFGENGPAAAKKTLAQKEKARGVINIDKELYNKSVKPSEAYETRANIKEGAGRESVPSGRSTETASAEATAGTTERPGIKQETVTTKTGNTLTKETLPSGQYWLEQNTGKEGSKWTKLAQSGHKVEHLMDDTKAGGFAGKVRVDGKEYTYDQAEKKFLKPNKIFESASVAKEAPEVVVTPEVKKDVLKSLVSGERRAPKVERAESIYKDIYTTGEGRLGDIESSDRRKYASKVMNVLNGLDVDVNNAGVPSSARIERPEYRRIRQAAIDNLKSKSLSDIETKFDVNQEISFKRGGSLPTDKTILEDEKNIIAIDNKRLLDIPLDESDMEFIKDYNSRLPKGERPISLTNREAAKTEKESFADKQKRWDEGVKLFRNVFEKAGKMGEGSAQTLNVREFKSTLDKNIKEQPKNTYSYGFSKAFDGYMKHMFGNDYQNNWGLNSYFGTESKKGQNFWQGLYKTMNENQHPISQPRDVMEKLIKKLREKPYDQFTADDKKEIYGARKKQAAEIAEAPKKERLKQSDLSSLTEKEVMDLDMAIRGLEQGEGLNVTDMTKLDTLSAGRIGAELGILPDAAAGSRDARALAINLMSEYNSNVRHDNSTYKSKTPKKLATYDTRVMDAIEGKIKKEMEESQNNLRKSRTSNLNERYSNIKRSVESMERLKKEGNLPGSEIATLERNRRILSSLEKERAK